MVKPKGDQGMGVAAVDGDNPATIAGGGDTGSSAGGVTALATRSPTRSTRRGPIPTLADNPVLERLDIAPTPAPSPRETAHDKMRRNLIAEPGQWIVLATRTRLTEAQARRTARSYQRAKPARLITTATGRFTARPFTRDGTWLVAACYEPPPVRR